MYFFPCCPSLPADLPAEGSHTSNYQQGQQKNCPAEPQPRLQNWEQIKSLLFKPLHFGEVCWAVSDNEHAPALPHGHSLPTPGGSHYLPVEHANLNLPCSLLSYFPYSRENILYLHCKIGSNLIT